MPGMIVVPFAPSLAYEFGLLVFLHIQDGGIGRLVDLDDYADGPIAP